LLKLQPRAALTATEGGVNSFEFGLQRLLDGVSHRLDLSCLAALCCQYEYGTVPYSY